MNFYLIIGASIVSIILASLLWRYYIEPYYLLRKNPQWKSIQDTKKFLSDLYRTANPAIISQNERLRLNKDEDAFTYGEITFASFLTILDQTKPQPNEIFYDLGSGSGKAVFVAALFFDFGKIRGIELLPGLYEFANSQIQKAQIQLNHAKHENAKQLLNQISKIEFFNEDFLNHDYSDGDVFFINATCISYSTWDAIVKKLEKTKPGTRVIVTTKKIDNEHFTLQSHRLENMSWGLNSVNIYMKN